MDPIKEKLQKMAQERKERSKDMRSQASSEIDKDKASSSSTIQTSSSDSEGIKDTKVTILSCAGDGVKANEKQQLPVEEKKLKSWRSESEIKPLVNKQQIIRPPVSRRTRAPSAQPVNDHNAKPPRRERTNSNSNMNSNSEIIVNDKTYQRLNVLGKGGSSIVYQAFSRHYNRCVAIKIVNLAEADESVREAYANEIHLLAQLQGSPYVVKMYEYEKRKDRLYVVMECGDIDLASFMLNKTEQMDEKFVKYQWQEMLKCVQVIHDKNIVHSDLKPANFLFVGASLKLIDFGIASNIPSNKTSIHKDTQVGTLNYISPEALNGSYKDSNGQTIYKIPLKSDVWSLGCILYAMVYGRTPFQHIGNQLAKIHAISSEQHVIEYPKKGKGRDRMLVDVIKKCLVRDVKNRASIEQLLKHPYLDNTITLTTPSPARPSIPITKQLNLEKENAQQKRLGCGNGLRVIK